MNLSMIDTVTFRILRFLHKYEFVITFVCVIIVSLLLDNDYTALKKYNVYKKPGGTDGYVTYYIPSENTVYIDKLSLESQITFSEATWMTKELSTRDLHPVLWKDIAFVYLPYTLACLVVAYWVMFGTSSLIPPLREKE